LWIYFIRKVKLKMEVLERVRMNRHHQSEMHPMMM
jgi:hypothetical protein